MHGEMLAVDTVKPESRRSQHRPASTLAAVRRDTISRMTEIQMADLIRFIITNFWPFVATCILISVAGSAIADIVRAIRGVA